MSEITWIKVLLLNIIILQALIVQFTSSISIINDPNNSMDDLNLQLSSNGMTVFTDACQKHNNNIDNNNYTNYDRVQNYKHYIKCSFLRLDGSNYTWFLKSQDGIYNNIPVSIPNDILSNLQYAKIIDDPHYELNFLSQRHVWMGGSANNFTTIHTTTDHHHSTNNSKLSKVNQTDYDNNISTRTRVWTYETNFTLPSMTIDYHNDSSNNESHDIERSNRLLTKSNYSIHKKYPIHFNYQLVIEGIKMGATIEINGVRIGQTTNQFLRHIIPIPINVLEKGYYHQQTSSTDDLTHEMNDHTILRKQHNISITFPPTLGTNGRFMACSGGWDWAMYSQEYEYSKNDHTLRKILNTNENNHRRRVLTFGIIKPIYIVQTYCVSIINVVPKVYHGSSIKPFTTKGKSNTRIARESIDEKYITLDDSVFQLVVDVHLQLFPTCDIKSNTIMDGIIILKLPFLEKVYSKKIRDFLIVKGNNPYDESYRNNEDNQNHLVVIFSILIPKADVELWWPNGMNHLGESKLYTIKVSYRNDSIGIQSDWVSKRVGFRTCELITSQNKTGGEGNGFHGMYFRINDKTIWARGANIIPMSQMEGRFTDDGYKFLVQSAASAKMNMLRVWGGGTILPDSFYDACDEYGIMIYHDMMFVEEQYHTPFISQEIEEEIKYIVRSLSSHPSIVLWNGCNECMRISNNVTDIYSQFVMRIVAQEDDTRVIWPNSPSSQGWRTGVYSDNGLPNGNDLTYWPLDLSRHVLEVHGPYRHGSSSTNPSVNGPLNEKYSNVYDTKIPLNVTVNKFGPEYTNQFVSELGASVYSSFESMSSVLSKDHWGIHGGQDPDSCTLVVGNENICMGQNVMAQRNYPCDNQIIAYFGDKVDLDSVGSNAFQGQLYKCFLSQLLWMKSSIEFLRNTNSFGLLIWQLNEIWPTGGWGVVEYGSKRNEPGQIHGGRWKPLMYLLERFLFRDVIASCGMGGRCFIKYDGSTGNFKGYVKVEKWDLIHSTAETVLKQSFDLAAGRGAVEYFSIPEPNNSDSEVAVITVYDDEGDEVMGQNTIIWTEPKNIRGLCKDTKVNSFFSFDGDNISITLQTDKTVLYVLLTSQAQGRFDQNAFSMKGGTEKVVQFYPMKKGDKVDHELLKNSLRIEHLGMSL